MGEYVLTLLAAAAVTYLLTPAVRRFAIAVGALHAARDRDVHVVPTPLLGGFAMYAGLTAGLLVASRLPALTGAFAEPNMSKGLLLAGGLVVVMGFVDDRWGLGALSKLAGQVAAGVILVWSGAEVTWLPLPGGGVLGLTTDQQTAATILVVVVTINAINFIDGLDGLAAGIVGIGAAGFFIYYYTLTHRLGLPDQTGPALASAVLVGICVGFLPHNFYPARIFMGDTGAMLLGLLLAYAPIASLASLDPASLTDHTAFAAGTVNRFGAFLPLLVPAAIMLIPYADLLMAVIRRTRAGTSVFAPDKKHLQHRLLAIGHSHRASVLIMYLWAALFSGMVVWLSIVRTSLYILIIVTGAAVLALALLLVSMPRLRPWARAASSAKSAARQPAPAMARQPVPEVARQPVAEAIWQPAPKAARQPAPEAVRQPAPEWAEPIPEPPAAARPAAPTGFPTAGIRAAAAPADPEATRPVPATSWPPARPGRASSASSRPGSADVPSPPAFGPRSRADAPPTPSPFGSRPVFGAPPPSSDRSRPTATEPAEPLFGSTPAAAGPSEPSEPLFGSRPAPAEPSEPVFGRGPEPSEPLLGRGPAAAEPSEPPPGPRPAVEEPFGPAPWPGFASEEPPGSRAAPSAASAGSAPEPPAGPAQESASWFEPAQPSANPNGSTPNGPGAKPNGSTPNGSAAKPNASAASAGSSSDGPAQDAAAEPVSESASWFGR
jgi:UDP-GlcNAc:undecaprenyl-phosphate GlcNAc-1-phosphate transferase